MRLVFRVAALAALCGLACGNDDDEHDARPASGGSAGTASAGASTAGTGAMSGSAGAGGAGGSEVIYEAPSISDFSPEVGTYGTLVTISGKGLGSAAREGVSLTVGNDQELELYPDSTPEVVSWSEEQIEFRYPFPAVGAVTVKTPQGEAVAGDFEPTWVVQASTDQGPTTALLASVSTGPARITALFDGSPPVLLEFGDDGVSELVLDQGDAATASLRLYLDEEGALNAFGISTGAAPQIVHLENQEGELVAVSTGIELDASEYVTAGGPDGAAVWMLRDDGWWRARPSAGVWEVDRGPIADPEPDEPLHAPGATSDGSLYIAYGIDTSFAFDDTETPYIKRLSPTATEFGPAAVAGRATDDYLTSLSLESRGRGLVVHYCGSDLDPFGLSGTELQCFIGLKPENGDGVEHAPKEGSKARHAFTSKEAQMTACDDSDALNLYSPTTTDMEAETVVFRCREPVAFEVDADGQPIYLLREGYLMRSLVRRPN